VTVTRRDLLRGSLAAAALLATGDVRRLLAAAGPAGRPPGELAGTLPFLLEPDEPLDRLLYDGLDARLYSDLSELTVEDPVTPPESFFVRTGVPAGYDPAERRTLRLDGRVERPADLAVETLAAESEDRGVHVVECAGNGRWARFGLLSAGRWAGVPLAPLVAAAGPLAGAAGVRVSGTDAHARPSTTSEPGCSWIFRLGELASSGAFLATALDGRPLAPVHGAPVRLAVPGWYGCCWVKWVDRIEVVGDDEPATAQMREFAIRTHQGAVHERARTYAPATVDTAALPVRVERWRSPGGTVYRVLGVLWGDDSVAAAGKLRIRFRPTDAWTPVSRPTAAADGGFSVWSHTWADPAPGRYLIQLDVDDPAVRSRRLDGGFYVRAVEVPPPSPSTPAER